MPHTCGSSSCTKLRLFIAYSLTLLLFSVFVSTLKVFSLNMGLIGPNGMLYLLYVRYLFPAWLRELFGDGLVDVTSTMLWMLGRWMRFFGLTYVRESNLCLSGIEKTSSVTRKRILLIIIRHRNRVLIVSEAVETTR